MPRAHELNTEPTIGLMEHMLALDFNGYWMLPLGKGKDGKEPRAKFKDRNAMPLDTIRTIMTQKQSSVFGVRCAGLVVVDVDTMTDETLAYCEQRFPASPFTVKTRKGEHRYYRSGDKPPGNIVTEEMHIDIKHGKNMFVVGPGSVRPDTGDEYRMNCEPLPPIHELPMFRDYGQQSTSSEITIEAASPTDDGQVDQNDSVPSLVGLDGRGVPDGERFDHLKSVARDFVLHADSEASLLKDLREYAKDAFEDFDTFPERKFHDVAKWNWKNRTSNNRWGGSNSAVVIKRHETQALDKFDNGTFANRLLQDLRHNFGAQPGKRFEIVTEKMAETDVIPGWSRSRYHRSKETLVKAGLLRCVKRGYRLKGTNVASLYQLTFIERTQGR